MSGRGGRGGRGRGSSGRGRGGGGGGRYRRKDCIDFKLLGKCERHETGECHFEHNHQEMTVDAMVRLPDKVHVPLSMVTKGEFLRVLRNIKECSLRASSDLTSIEIVVSEQNAHHLPTLEREYNKLLSQLYPIGPGWCYIHREGVEQCVTGGSLQFSIYKGRIPLRPGDSKSRILHELCMTESAESGEASGLKKVVEEMKSPHRESETKEGLHKAIDRIHGKGQDYDSGVNRKDVGVKIIRDHETHMKDMLKGGLGWFCSDKRIEGQFVAKLEGRFGKILWKGVPEDMLGCRWGLTEFADLCFSDTRHSRIFTTDVKQESAGAVRRELNEERISLLETFDIKFTIPGDENRKAVDIRVKFVDGRPYILTVKKNEAKIVIFDVLCLHRKHDMRMTLNYYEVVSQDSPEYRVVEQLLKTVSLSDGDTISLVMATDEWSVNFIRHKKREVYRIDDKYIATVTDIREVQLTKEEPNTLVSLTKDSYSKCHTEIEFHNCSWECAFGRDVDFPPEKALALHMEDPTVSPEVAGAVPHPWQPEDILEDFQEFYENLDTLNEMLGIQE